MRIVLLWTRFFRFDAKFDNYKLIATIFVGNVTVILSKKNYIQDRNRTAWG